ncbi:hemolysin family protein [Halostella litorea]|uniref:hemolysin family protein n=1 Tax=Halostella litorea TaxID=2528831 RepID=UPI0010921F21|nr:hemolysin family protein [Halostella litorea]
MVDVVLSGARLLFALFLVFLNGFFVAAEFAFVRIRPARVESMVAEGKTGAATVQNAIDNLDDYLAVSQLGITLASLGLGWIGEPAVAALLDPVLAPLLPESAIHVVSVAVGFGVITFLHVVFGELAPKTLAIQEAERIALLVAAPMKLCYYLFVPGIIVFNGTANFFTGLVGVSPATEHDESHTEEEILRIVARSGEAGGVDSEEVKMIESVFEMDDTIAREVMVPRHEVATVPASMALSDLRRVATEETYTRYLVLDEAEDDEVVGFVHVKDVLRAVESMDDSVTARELAHDVLVVPETRQTDDLLVALREAETPMAAVIDEWGAFEGIVTVEDVLEQLVGDIRDEYDRESDEPGIEARGDGAYRVDGGVAIAEVNDRLDTDFESDAFETVGGLVLSRIGRAPEAGDEVDLDGHRFRVETVDGSRIESLDVRPAGSNGEETAAGGDGAATDPED